MCESNILDLHLVPAAWLALTSTLIIYYMVPFVHAFALLYIYGFNQTHCGSSSLPRTRLPWYCTDKPFGGLVVGKIYMT